MFSLSLMILWCPNTPLSLTPYSLPDMPTPKPSSSIHPARTPLVCGEHGDHSGEVIGCCHVCGLMLCQGHANYLPRRGMAGLRALHRFGMAEEQEASPLVCGDHAPPFAARAGLPSAPVRRSGVQRGWRRFQLWSRLSSIFRRNKPPRREPPPAHSRRG